MLELSPALTPSYIQYPWLFQYGGHVLSPHVEPSAGLSAWWASSPLIPTTSLHRDKTGKVQEYLCKDEMMRLSQSIV